MEKQQNFPLNFSCGYVKTRDLVFIASEVDDLANQGFSHTKMLQWKAGIWKHYLIKWPVVEVCGIEESGFKLLAMGLDGRVHLASKGGFTEEVIDNSTEGPEYRGDLRDMRVIDKNVYVAGMGRQVYKRIGTNNWIRIDQTTLVPIGSGEIAGFNSIDGFNEKEIYAVGFNGEIWQYNGNFWVQIESPTNLAIQRVKCITQDTVYACGQAGLLVRGRGNTWEAIDHSATNSNLWGLEWFQENLFVASSDKIFFLDKNTLVPVDMNLGKELSCGYLHANDDVMWSIGTKDLAYTDGTVWVEVTCV